MKRECENCKWWDGDDHNGPPILYGRCRANPPTIYVGNDSKQKGCGVWPITDRDDWCSFHHEIIEEEDS